MPTNPVSSLCIFRECPPMEPNDILAIMALGIIVIAVAEAIVGMFR